MEIVIFIIHLLIVLIIGASAYAYIEEHNIKAGFIFLLLFTLILLSSLFANLTIVTLNREPIIIEKSSDSDWELSTNYKIKSDTCITEIKLIKNLDTNQIDTVYPTTCYKVLKSIN